MRIITASLVQACDPSSHIRQSHIVHEGLKRWEFTRRNRAQRVLKVFIMQAEHRRPNPRRVIRAIEFNIHRRNVPISENTPKGTMLRAYRRRHLQTTQLIECIKTNTSRFGQVAIARRSMAESATLNPRPNSIATIVAHATPRCSSP